MNAAPAGRPAERADDVRIITVMMIGQASKPFNGFLAKFYNCNGGDDKEEEIGRFLALMFMVLMFFTKIVIINMRMAVKIKTIMTIIMITMMMMP